MGKTLIICEKPSVASDVSKALPGKFAKSGDFFESDDYVVGAAVGHLVEQVDPEQYDPKLKRWRYEDLPIIPDEFEYAARDARAQKTLSALHKAIRRKDVDELVNACDAGREGELIFKLIVQESGVDKPVRRAWFSSMTQRAIREAFEHLRPDEEMRGLEDAARSRSEADWLVGINASRAAGTKVGSARSRLSLGRVQTPTLALVVGRDTEIDRFVPEDYWQVRATFATEGGETYTGLWRQGSRERLGAAEEAERIAAAARGADGRVASVEQKPIVEQPPLLYDLTTLQREANQRFGFTADRTLRAAQALYEQHKALTYPRTNSRYLSSDLYGSLQSIAGHVGRAGEQYAAAAAYVTGLDLLPRERVVNDAKVTDHHAIIPTDDAHQLSALTSDQRRIYDLVARRFLAVFHPPARFEQTTVRTEAGGETFRSTGKVQIDAGWRAAYEPTVAERREGEDEAEQRLPALAADQPVSVPEVDVLAKQTKPPARYNESSLLRAMETAGKLVEDDEAAEAMKESGLGTPATRAATIERLIDAEYLLREGKSLRATDKGTALIRMLGDHQLTRPDLTGRWEKRLLDMEAGRDDRETFMRDIRGFTTDTVRWFADKDRSAMRLERREIGPCPRCDGTIVERPKSYSCTSWKSAEEPGCGFTIWKQHGGRTISPEEAAELVAAGKSSEDLQSERVVIGPCPTEGCGGEIVERAKSFGCTSWKSRTEPGCGYVIWKRPRGAREDVTVEEARALVAAGKTNAVVRSTEPIGDCPTPGCGGQIVENSRAFGCTSWKSRKEPGCGFVIWKRQRGAPAEVTREEATRMLAEGTVPAPAAAPSAEPLGPCPTEGCGGEIKERARSYGCTSWKSKSKPGCGYVIWKQPRGLGREIGREEAIELVRLGLTEPPSEGDAAA